MTGPRLTPIASVTLARSRAATRLLQAEAAEARGDRRTAQQHRKAASTYVAEADRLAGIHIPSPRR